jgi:hypothetical protein
MKRTLENFVYGATDIAVTTFAVVAGSHAFPSPSVVLMLGSANLIAGGFSRAVGELSGYKDSTRIYGEEGKKERGIGHI